MTARRAYRTAVLTSLLLLAACQTAGTAAAPELSRFLSDHEQLQPGRADQAQLIYINPEANFAPYQRVLIEPVVLWEPDGEKLSDVPRPELEQLSRSLQESMRRELAQEFDIVEEPEPGTLRLRLALVDVERSSTSSDAVFMGTVSIEVEVLDASSGERLVAAADLRGNREPVDVGKAFDTWAARARARLSAFRAFDAVHAPSDGD